MSIYRVAALTAVFLSAAMGVNLAYAEVIAQASSFPVPASLLDIPYDHENTMILLAIFLVTGISVLIYALRESIKEKSLLPAAIVLSTLFLAFTEVLVDVMGGVFYPISKEHNLLSILGRETNYIVLGWLTASLWIYVTYRFLMSGISTKGIWILYISLALINFVMEETFLNLFTAYVYYGNQPLILVNKFPLWWGFCTHGAMVCTGILAYRFRESLTGWKSISLLLATPMVFGGFYGFAGLPAFIVVNGNYSWLVTQAGGILTVLMAFSGVALAIKLGLDRDLVTWLTSQSMFGKRAFIRHRLRLSLNLLPDVLKEGIRSFQSDLFT